MIEPVKKLSLVLHCLTSDLPIPANLQAWLIDVLGRWNSGESLPIAFDISGSVNERRCRRDIELKEYSATLDGGLWDKSKTIAEEIKKVRKGRRNTSPIFKRIDAILPTLKPIWNTKPTRQKARLFRGVGNQAGRGRRNADMAGKPAYYPRSMMITSGEDLPRGASLPAGLGSVFWESLR